MNHMFGGILGGVAFGLLAGLLVGSCVFQGGPNHQATSGVAASGAGQEGAQARPPSETPGGMDPGQNAMEAVFAKVGKLKDTIEKEPTNRAAIIELANLYYDASKYPQAIALYEKALAIDRGDPNILTDAANAYWLSGNPEKALAMLQETKSRFPSHWQSAASLFYLAANRKDAALAGEELQRVKRLNPGFEKLSEMEKVYEDLHRGGRG